MAIDTIKSSAVLDGAIATADIADDAVTSAKLDTNIAVAGTLGVTGATSLSNNLSLVKNQAAHTNIDVFNNSGSASAKSQIRVGYDASNCLEIFRVGNNANIIQNATQNGSIIFQGAGTEMMRMSTAGLAIGGTGAANTLDDYEEGTWTPSYTSSGTALPSITYNIAYGSYVKVGRLVVATFSMGTNSLSSIGSASGDLRISGLPFTHASGSIARSVSHVMSGRFAQDTPAQTIVSAGSNVAVMRENFDTTTQANDLNVTGSSNRNVSEGHIIYYTD